MSLVFVVVVVIVFVAVVVVFSFIIWPLTNCAIFYHLKYCTGSPLKFIIHVHVCLSRDLIDSVVAVAENTADELLRNQGQEVTLEEDPQLQLPFLLPEDRYSCEVIRGVPPGLKEFLNPLAGIGK